MAGSPIYKIYNPQKEYIGSMKYREDAAAMVSFLGNGAKVLLGHNKKAILWHEGHEEISAGESYDRAAEVMKQRHNDFYEERWGEAR